MQILLFLVISIGTSSEKKERLYDAETAATWGSLGWVYQLDQSIPLVDMLTVYTSAPVQIWLIIISLWCYELIISRPRIISAFK